MNHSETIDKFAGAMAKVQAEIGGAVKGSVNPAFKSKYADLSAVWEAWQAIGPANGLAVIQLPGVYDAEAKTMGMDQLITHSSGQWVSGYMTIPLTKADAQGYGSACTYARRYALSAAVGICPEDDDGNAAVKSAPANDRQNGNGHGARQTADRDAPFPQGPAKNKTELKEKGRALWADVMACEDRSALEALLASHKPLIDQLKVGLPQWWGGGTRDGEPYEGLGQVIERLERDFEGIAEAGTDWRGNPILAG